MNFPRANTNFTVNEIDNYNDILKQVPSITVQSVIEPSRLFTNSFTSINPNPLPFSLFVPSVDEWLSAYSNSSAFSAVIPTRRYLLRKEWFYHPRYAYQRK